MNKYIQFLQRFRWAVIIGIPLIVIALASSLKNTQMDGSYRIWFGEGSQTLVEYDEFRSTFGNDDGIVIVFKDSNGIFNKKALKSIDNITQALWKTKYIARVDSLTNYQYMHASEQDPDDIRIEDFIQNIDQATQEYLTQKEQIAINDSIIKGVFISSDATTTMISARLTPKVNDKEDKSIEIMDLIEKILAPEIARTGYKYHISGGPALNKSFTIIGTHDAMTFTPIILLASMILLFLLFRRVSGSLIPIAVVLMTFLTVLAVQVLLGFKLNNFTANLPVFVVAIGIADAVHIYSIWLLRRREGYSSYDSVLYSLSKNFLPVFLTSITTTIGFATLTISNVVPIFTLGIATASGAMLAFVISVLWMPALLLTLTKPIKTKILAKTKAKKPLGYGKFIVKHSKKIVFFTTIVFLVIGIGIFKVKVDSNTIRYFDKSVDIRQSTEFIMANLTGPMAYEIVIDSKEPQGIKEPKFMKTVQRFYSDMYDEFDDVRHLSSLMDIIKRLNLIMTNKDEIPNSKAIIAQYLFLYSMSLPQGMELNDKMDINEQKLRITGQINIVDTSKDLEIIDYINNWWSDTDYSVSLQGQTVMFAHMQSDVTDTLIYSLSLALMLVSLVMLLIFRRIRLLWVFVLPNILPVALVVGIMGWIGINIDIGVAIAGAIIIGVAVDDTIHFLVKYFDARRRGLNMEDTFDEVLRYAGRAILFTTIILTIAFSLFAFSTFTPNQNFGIVTAFALGVAFVIDLLLLPALLCLVDKE